MRRWFALLLLAISLNQAAAAESPTLWGVGVEGCVAYSQMHHDWRNQQPRGLEQYPIFREWFLGLISGISVASGLEILHGVAPEAALRRIAQICQDRPELDFFTATILFTKQLSIPGAENGLVIAPSPPTSATAREVPSLEQLPPMTGRIPLAPVPQGTPQPMMPIPQPATQPTTPQLRKQSPQQPIPPRQPPQQQQPRLTPEMAPNVSPAAPNNGHCRGSIASNQEC